MSYDPLQVQSWFSSEENESDLRTLSGILVESVQTTAVYTHDCLRTLPVFGQMLLVLYRQPKKKWRPTFGCLFLPRITVCHATLYLYDMHIMIIYGYWSKPWHLVNPKIAGKWMFIPLELIIIGFDPPPYVFRKSQHETHTETPLGRGPPFAAASVFAKPRGSGSALRFQGILSMGGFKGLVYLPLLSLLLLRMGFFNPKKSCHLKLSNSRQPPAP